MRQFPKFTREEIVWLEKLVHDSSEHLLDSEIFKKGICMSYDNFKNDLVNKLIKYLNVISEMGFKP